MEIRVGPSQVEIKCSLQKNIGDEGLVVFMVQCHKETVSDQMLTFKEDFKLEYLLIIVAWHFHNLEPILINKAIHILHLGFQHTLQISILHRDFIIHMLRLSFPNYILVQQR
jgi:hypothetical protein